MAHITAAGGPSNWREAFLAHPGLAVTPENYDRLTAAAEPAAARPEPEPEPVPVPVPPARPQQPPAPAVPAEPAAGEPAGE